MKQKRLLVLAAGRLQLPVITKAKELGYYVIAADGDKDAIGFKSADKAICVNITDPEEMLRIAIQEKIDGVIHPCSEVSMSVMGKINDRLKLSGVSEEAALRATNKHLMRQAFDACGAPSPLSRCLTDADEAWHAFKTQYENAAILKPSRNSGSRGIHKIDRSTSADEFKRLFDHSMSESRDKSVMLEQFIDGPEFSVEIIVWNGSVNILTVTDKKTTGAPHFVELGHSQPSLFSKQDIAAVEEAAAMGVKALGVDNCACHAEIKLQHDTKNAPGKAYIMEIGARLGGDFISTVLTELSTGVDMVAAAIKCSLGETPDLSPHKPPQGACIRYFCPPSGRLLSITDTDQLNRPDVYNHEIYISPGDIIPEVTSSLSRSGHVIVVGQTAGDAIALAEHLLEQVKFKVLI